jgi:phenylalanyl-tRNA synthetase beta chain
MKYSMPWLQEWVKPRLGTQKLSDALTLAGLEVEGIADEVMDVAITPNRGDCLSIRGLAREIAALTRTTFKAQAIRAVRPTVTNTIAVRVQATTHCPRYVARVIRNLPLSLKTPAWMAERLMKSGMNLIHPIVDITNYVLLELGQPMHAFDLSHINHDIIVRLAKPEEKIILLDDSEQSLQHDTLIIADREKPLAIAGLMGGLHSGVTAHTTEIVLESAYFLPSTVARAREQYHLQSESSARFERGVDPTQQREALERATALILELAPEASIGPAIERSTVRALPLRKPIYLADEMVSNITGINIKNKEIESIFKALNFNFKRASRRWVVRPPAYRSDLALPEDLVEEIMRLHGYQHLPARLLCGTLHSEQFTDLLPDRHALKSQLAGLGYHEIISYSFVDRDLQLLLNPDVSPLPLLHPISQEMAVMRTNLWPGLLQAFQYNQNRQQALIHLFEIGTIFLVARDRPLECPRIAGLLAGPCHPEQWGISTRAVDFYDIKGHVEAILEAHRLLEVAQFQVALHPALHPGSSAQVLLREQPIGWVGALHPRLLQQFKLTSSVFVFELDLSALNQRALTHFVPPSAFPAVRRDLAILIGRAVPLQAIQDTIKGVAGPWLTKVFVFDVYQGKGVPPDMKSVASGLLFQSQARTLLEEEVNAAMDQVVSALTQQFGATLRSSGSNAI